MSAATETLADIVAEMRALAESAEAWQGGVAAATLTACVTYTGGKA